MRLPLITTAPIEPWASMVPVPLPSPPINEPPMWTLVMSPPRLRMKADWPPEPAMASLPIFTAPMEPCARNGTAEIARAAKERAADGDGTEGAIGDAAGDEDLHFADVAGHLERAEFAAERKRGAAEGGLAERGNGEALHEPSLVVASPTVSWSRVAFDGDFADIVAGGIDVADADQAVAGGALEHGEGEVGVLDAAGAEIKSLQLLAEAGWGEHEIAGGECAAGDFDGDGVAIDIGEGADEGHRWR